MWSGVGMTQLQDVQQFVELSEQAEDFGTLDRLLHGMTNAMGFDYYALVQHVDMRNRNPNSVICLENYPPSWAEVFVITGLYAVDPIHLASQRTNVGFTWSNVADYLTLEARHRAILEQAGKEGMGDGFTVPAHIPGESTGSCSFGVRRGKTLPRENLMMAQLVGSFAFEAGRRLLGRLGDDAPWRLPPRLTPRQKDCVSLIAQGKTDWEIGRILGIAETTVRDYIEDACRRYDVRRRVQLVVRALHDGQLTLADCLR